MSLPNRRQPFEACDYIKAREYLDERVRAGDFNPRPRPVTSEERGALGHVDPEAPAAAMREKHKNAQNEEDLGVFG